MQKGEEAKRRAHEARLAALRERTHKKIDYHLQKPYVDVQEFYRLVREFFLDLLEKQYEPTYEEIIDELENIDHDFLAFSEEQRKDARELLGELSALEYSGKDVPQDALKDVLRRFRDLADELASYEEETIEHALQTGFAAAKGKDIEKARAAYRKAHKLFQKLGAPLQKQYLQELQELYKQVQSPQSSRVDSR